MRKNPKLSACGRSPIPVPPPWRCRRQPVPPNLPQIPLALLDVGTVLPGTARHGPGVRVGQGRAGCGSSRVFLLCTQPPLHAQRVLGTVSSSPSFVPLFILSIHPFTLKKCCSKGGLFLFFFFLSVWSRSSKEAPDFSHQFHSRSWCTQVDLLKC